MTKPTGKPRGRPSFQPTAKMRDDVSIWKAGGMSDEDIARVLGVDADTMKKHFADELSTHWAKKTAQVINARFRAAIKGNVTAQTKFLETARAVGGNAHMVSAPGPKTRKVPMGKKEAAAIAAEKAGDGSEWGEDLRYPPTVVQ